MTSSSQTLPRHLPVLAPGPPAPAGPVARVRDAIAGFACQIRGHVPRLGLSDERIWLFCPDCRRATEGWELDGPRPRLRQPGDPARFERYRWLTGVPVPTQAADGVRAE
ncbi:MAG TPA: hypothetical protein VF136_12545 [Methylomirabilota bacterium]